MNTLATIYRAARARLAGAGVENAALDARLLVEGILGAKAEALVCRPAMAVDAAQAEAVEESIARRQSGEPVHRILGWREFYGLKLELSPETLEPRPDTETLVDAVLPFVKASIAQQGHCAILDLGVGTGAIPLAILSQAPEAKAVATDIAAGALETAGRNADALGLSGRFTAVHSDWFANVSGRFDLIVSNPPYIRSDVIGELDEAVRRHDPILALDGGTDGLDAYRVIVAGAPAHLSLGGMLALEIGFDQAESVALLLASVGFDVAPVIRDLGGNDRVLLAKMRQ